MPSVEILWELRAFRLFQTETVLYFLLTTNSLLLKLTQAIGTSWTECNYFFEKPNFSYFSGRIYEGNSPKAFLCFHLCTSCKDTKITLTAVPCPFCQNTLITGVRLASHWHPCWIQLELQGIFALLPCSSSWLPAVLSCPDGTVPSVATATRLPWGCRCCPWCASSFWRGKAPRARMGCCSVGYATHSSFVLSF